MNLLWTSGERKDTRERASLTSELIGSRRSRTSKDGRDVKKYSCQTPDDVEIEAVVEVIATPEANVLLPNNVLISSSPTHSK